MNFISLKLYNLPPPAFFIQTSVLSIFLPEKMHLSYTKNSLFSCKKPPTKIGLGTFRAKNEIPA